MLAATMLITAIKATIGITIILGGWVLVQVAWRRVFPGTPPGDDVLAGRIGCHQCTTCATPCEFADQDHDPDHEHDRNHGNASF